MSKDILKTGYIDIGQNIRSKWRDGTFSTPHI